MAAYQTMPVLGLLLAFLLTLSSAAPQERERAQGRAVSSGSSSKSSSPPVTPVPILRQINEILEDGSYRFGYEAGDGSFRIETRQPDGSVRGKYGFRDADGQIRVVDYSANNETGFDAQGEHIPKGPPPARARPDDVQDEDEQTFTTSRPRGSSSRPRRPRPQPRPQPQPQPQVVSTPAPRPRQQRPRQQRPQRPQPPPVQQEAFEEPFDEQQLSLLEQDFAPQARPQPQPQRQPPSRPRQRPSNSQRQRPQRPPPPQSAVFNPPEDNSNSGLHFVPVESPPRAVTSVQQSGDGSVIARPPRPDSSNNNNNHHNNNNDFFDGLSSHVFNPPQQQQQDFAPPPRPRGPRPSSNNFRGSSSGSAIDDFLANVPPSGPPTTPRPRNQFRRPVFDDDDFNSFGFGPSNNSPQFRPFQPQQPQQQEVRSALGATHGFIFRDSGAGDIRFDRRQFANDDRAHLVQTVPGAPNPIVQTQF